ncbi:MAG: 3-dehydroquinate synthase [Flavobacteriaceae bacterium]|nr:3-dehydroquinate synthase [Flavobacteriaceae bacterium]
MKSLKSSDCDIHFNIEGYDHLNDLIARSNYSKVVALVDENTHDHCLPELLELLKTDDLVDVIEIEAGEENKSIDTCSGVWNALSELGCDRKSLLINLGGGVVTDLGGFVASTFKRGIDYVNIPTSLLAMVDASVGGKTGVDLESLKNQIGVINEGKMVLIDSSYLATLPENHVRSGLAEMLKHGLISNESYWDKMVGLSGNDSRDMDNLIYESVKIKLDIVAQDPHENGLRKTLNFGHTLGHAIESLHVFHKENSSLLHGEAVAIGMILATYLSYVETGFPKDKLEQIKKSITDIFGNKTIEESDYQSIISLLKFDKKNSHGNINFVLLEDIGKPKLDCIVDEALIIDAFNYYNS